MPGIIGHYMTMSHTSESRKKLVGERLAMIRKEAKLTQKEVCEIISITPQTYSGYEKGKHEPTMETLVRLSMLYGTTIDFILCRNDALDERDKLGEMQDYVSNIVENRQIKEVALDLELLRQDFEDFKNRMAKDNNEE